MADLFLMLLKSETLKLEKCPTMVILGRLSVSVGCHS